MCLLSVREFPRTTNQDISIFKILTVEKDKLLSPWKSMEYELNELYINKCEVIPKKMYDYYIIESGYYHAFVNLKSVLSKINHYPELKKLYKNGKLKIFKGIIPKNSKCYLGVENDIASNQIKIIEECMN